MAQGIKRESTKGAKKNKKNFKIINLSIATQGNTWGGKVKFRNSTLASVRRTK